MACLTKTLFSEQEKLPSNLCGICGKKALNCFKLKAVHSTCLKHYPLEKLETVAVAEKEMRNAIDEVCRKTLATESM